MYKFAVLRSPVPITRRSENRTPSWKTSLIALIAIALNFTNSAAAQTPGQIDFGTNVVPAVPNALTVIRTSPQAPPVAFVQDAMGKMGAQASNIGPLAKSPLLAARSKNIPESTMGLVENGHVRVLWDQKSGDAEIFPDLAKNLPFASADSAGVIKQKALAAARQIFARADVIARDDTQFTVGEPRPVMTSQAARNADGATVNESAGSVYLTYVSLQRKVNGYPVYGPGSNASVAIGNDGSVQGFVKRWNTGLQDGSVKETRTQDEVKAAIQKLLQPLTASANVQVRSIEVAYYDDHADAIQPVYRITARVHFLPQAIQGVKPAGKATNDEYIVRYLPIDANITLGVGDDSSMPSNADKPTAPVSVPPDDPTVGRYVVRNDDSGWVASANSFWNGISSSPFGGWFTNVQYFWAYPYEFTTNELSYVNSVNVALTEVHGDWWLFTTYQNWGDIVRINDITASNGYGPAAGGQLRYWILHSCEVVPAPIDAPCATDNRAWWTPWFDVFQGMHTVVGYRTIMYINDSVTYQFGKDLELGAPVISAWFNAVNSASDYSGHPTEVAHCGTSLPMGKPSAVTVCGHNNDTIYDEAALPAASCLTSVWQPN